MDIYQLLHLSVRNPPEAQHTLTTQNWRKYEKQREIETLNDLAPLRSLKNDFKKKKVVTTT